MKHKIIKQNEIREIIKKEYPNIEKRPIVFEALIKNKIAEIRSAFKGDYKCRGKEYGVCNPINCFIFQWCLERENIQ